MYKFIYIFLGIIFSFVEVFSTDDSFIEDIKKVALKDFSDQENIKTLRKLVYQQNCTHSNATKKEFLNYLVRLYDQYPLIRIGYNNPRVFDKNKGYITLCFFIQKDYHHAALVFEYSGLWSGIDAELCHLTYAEESGSHREKKRVYRIYCNDKKAIINKLIWSENNKSGNDEKPDHGILGWYPYFTFEVDSRLMFKALAKIRWTALLQKEHPYDYMGLWNHNCCTYVAEQLEKMGINLNYRKSYNLYFTDNDLKRVVDTYAIRKGLFYKHGYNVKYTEHDKDKLPFAFANRNNLFRVLKVASELEEENRKKLEAKIKENNHKKIVIDAEKEKNEQTFMKVCIIYLVEIINFMRMWLLSKWA